MNSADKLETENGYKTYYSFDNSKIAALAKRNKILIIITLILSLLAIIVAIAIPIFVQQYFQSEQREILLRDWTTILKKHELKMEQILHHISVEMNKAKNEIEQIEQLVQVNNQEIERHREGGRTDNF